MFPCSTTDGAHAALLLFGAAHYIHPHTQVWLQPGALADSFVDALTNLFSQSEAVIVAILVVFALAHSGLAYLRPSGTIHSL
jgi:hypothetical protein